MGGVLSHVVKPDIRADYYVPILDRMIHMYLQYQDCKECHQ